jgi:hypothetical protein
LLSEQLFEGKTFYSRFTGTLRPFTDKQGAVPAFCSRVSGSSSWFAGKDSRLTQLFVWGTGASVPVNVEMSRVNHFMFPDSRGLMQVTVTGITRQRERTR